MTFFERFEQLATSENLKPNTVAKELGLPSGSVTAWKKGTVPRIATLDVIAARFNVSVDYLRGLSDNPNPPGMNEKAPAGGEDLQMDDIEYALYGEVRELDEEDKAELLRAARRMRELRELKEKNKKR